HLSDPPRPARRGPDPALRSRRARPGARACHAQGGGVMSEQRLRVEDGFAGRGDDFYEALIRAHEGLSEAESHRLNARLVLILANQIGDLALLREALALARQ